jgi:hypothetical protein
MGAPIALADDSSICRSVVWRADSILYLAESHRGIRRPLIGRVWCPVGRSGFDAPRLVGGVCGGTGAGPA